VIRLLSPAKLNLGLWVLYKRPDNYHEIVTIFQTISLFDEIIIKEGPLRVETSTHIPQEENLVYRAIRKMERVLGRELDFSVYINKNIPEGGGLGGGSSNVATVLKALNELVGSPLSLEELHQIAQKVSSDAPFFLYGGSAVGRGRGEIINKVELPRFRFTVLCPKEKVSTAKVYHSLTPDLLTEEPDVDKILNCLRVGDFSVLSNRLGELSSKLYPSVGEVLRFLEALGIKALVSGSGGCVFYIGEPTKEVELACRSKGWHLFSVESYGV